MVQVFSRITGGAAPKGDPYVTEYLVGRILDRNFL